MSCIACLTNEWDTPHIEIINEDENERPLLQRVTRSPTCNHRSPTITWTMTYEPNHPIEVYDETNHIETTIANN